MSEVSVLGTGRMGAALARVLLGHGVDVCVWNRTSAKNGPLVADGARSAETPDEAVRASPLSIVMVSDHAAVLDVLGAVPVSAEADGRVVLNLTTGAPEQVGACQEACRERGLGYLDGAVSGHPEDIGRPASQILVAGDERAWQAHRGTVERLAGETIYLGGDATAASALDMALVGCFQTVGLCAFLEAAAYAAAHGIDPTVLPPLAERLLTKMRGQVSVLTRAIASANYATDQASIGVYVAALEQIRTSMRAVGVPARLTTAAWENASPAVAAGRGDEGLATQFPDLTGSGDGV